MDGRPDCSPSHWDNNYKIFYLTEKMRSLTDPKFGEVCDRIALGNISEEDELYLKNLVRKSPNQNNNDLFKSGEMSIIVTTNKRREKINLEKLERLLPDSQEFVCNSRDQSTNISNPPELSNKLNYTMTGNLEKSLKLKVGAPIMITVNNTKAKYREDGVCNGARAYIDSFQMAEGSDIEVRYIWVVFKDMKIGQQLRNDNRHLLKLHKPTHNKAVPIEVCKIKFNVGTGNVSYQRTQFPAVLAYAVTSYRSQGDTLKEVIVDFTSEGKDKPYIVEGSFYVSITRAKSSENVFLEDFDKSYIKVSKDVLEKITAMRKFQYYTFKKIYLSDRIFILPNKELKVGYLNIRDITAQLHAEYINSDKNLLNLDVLVIAETWLTWRDSDEELAGRLDNFSILARHDAEDSLKHCGLLLLSSKQSTVNFSNIEVSGFKKRKGNDVHLQGVNLIINSLELAFLYIRQTPSVTDIEKIIKYCQHSSAILGDFNLNPRKPAEKKLLDLICGEDKFLALNEITRENNNQLDHILINNNLKSRVYATSYFNFISDHKSITMRVALEDNQFTQEFLHKQSYSKSGNVEQIMVKEYHSDLNSTIKLKEGNKPKESPTPTSSDNEVISQKATRRKTKNSTFDPKVTSPSDHQHVIREHPCNKLNSRKSKSKKPDEPSSTKNMLLNNVSPASKRSKPNKTNERPKQELPTSQTTFIYNDENRVNTGSIGNRGPEYYANCPQRRFLNSDSTSCWLNCCLQLVLTAMDANSVTFNSRLGRQLLELHRTNLRITLDSVAIRIILTEGEEERITSQKEMIRNTIADPSMQASLIAGAESSRLNLGTRQQCVRDFFIAICDNRESWLDVYTFLNYNVQGSIHCSNCGYTSNQEPEEELYCEMECPPDGSNLSEAVRVTFNEGEMIEYLCERGCRTRGHAVKKRMLIDVASTKFIILILKRTRQVQNMNSARIRAEIVNNNVTATENVSIKDIHGNEAVFEPISVVNHVGNMSEDGRSSGHYTADVKNQITKTWFKTSDNDRPIPIFPEDVTKKGYIILYRNNLAQHM